MDFLCVQFQFTTKQIIVANITVEIIGETVVEITLTAKNSVNKNFRKTITKNIRLKNMVLI